MKNRVYWILLLIVIFGFSIWFIGRRQGVKLALETYENQRKQSILSLNSYSYEYLQTVLSQNTQLKDEYLSDLRGEQFKLGQIVDTNLALFFVFDGLACNDCLSREAENLQFIQQNYPNYVVKIIVNNMSEREALVFLRNFNLDFPVYFLGADSEFNLPIELLDKPYWFFLNEDLIVKHVYLTPQSNRNNFSSYIKYFL